MISCSVKSLLEDVKVSAMVMSISASFGLEIWKLFVSCIYHLGIICFIISYNIIIYRSLGNHVCLTWTRFACSVVACLEVLMQLSSYTRGRSFNTRCQSTMSKILVSCCKNQFLLFMVAVFLLMFLVCGLMCIVSMCRLLIVDDQFVLITIVVPNAHIVLVLVAPLLLLLPSIFSMNDFDNCSGASS